MLAGKLDVALVVVGIYVAALLSLTPAWPSSALGWLQWLLIGVPFAVASEMVLEALGEAVLSLFSRRSRGPRG